MSRRTIHRTVNNMRGGWDYPPRRDPWPGIRRAVWLALLGFGFAFWGVVIGILT